MKVIWEPNLQIEKMRSSAERAILCQKSRGFKTTIEKNMKKCLMQYQKKFEALNPLLLGSTRIEELTDCRLIWPF